MTEAELRPMAEAKDIGPPIEVLALRVDKHGNRNWIVVHYAHGGGDEQPPFRGWFCSSGRDGQGWLQVDEHTLKGWMPLPEVPRAD